MFYSIVRVDTIAAQSQAISQAIGSVYPHIHTLEITLLCVRTPPEYQPFHNAMAFLINFIADTVPSLPNLRRLHAEHGYPPPNFVYNLTDLVEVVRHLDEVVIRCSTAVVATFNRSRNSFDVIVRRLIVNEIETADEESDFSQIRHMEFCLDDFTINTLPEHIKSINKKLSRILPQSTSLRKVVVSASQCQPSLSCCPPTCCHRPRRLLHRGKPRFSLQNRASEKVKTQSDASHSLSIPPHCKVLSGCHNGGCTSSPIHSVDPRQDTITHQPQREYQERHTPIIVTLASPLSCYVVHRRTAR